MSELQLLAPGQYRRMAWANGRGVTTEVARSPATEGEFDWRVSIARVDADGPFSLFPGIDRILVPLDGRGIRLEFPSLGRNVELPPLEAHSFPGDLEAIGVLLGSPIRDFNVMTRRGRARAGVQVVRGAGEITLDVGEALALVYCDAGEGSVAAEEGSVVLPSGSTVIASSPAGRIRLEPGDGAVFIAVTLEVRPG